MNINQFILLTERVTRDILYTRPVSDPKMTSSSSLTSSSMTSSSVQSQESCSEATTTSSSNTKSSYSNISASSSSSSSAASSSSSSHKMTTSQRWASPSIDLSSSLTSNKVVSEGRFWPTSELCLDEKPFFPVILLSVIIVALEVTLLFRSLTTDPPIRSLSKIRDEKWVETCFNCWWLEEGDWGWWELLQSGW